MAQVERWLVLTLAVAGGIMFLRSAVFAASRTSATDEPEPGSEGREQSRIERADDARERTPALPRYVLAVVSFGTAGALLASAIPPTVGYAILCLTLATRCIVDQIAEERAPRRRSALLGRSRRVDPVLSIWIGVGLISALSLVPSVVDAGDRPAAIMVAGCAVAMLAVAWRIAIAPPLLLGDDLEAEQVVDRETRATRTGAACFVAVAAVAVFFGFTGSSLSLVMLPLAFALFAWMRLYARQLGRTRLAV
jgi:hypothetical protein